MLSSYIVAQEISPVTQELEPSSQSVSAASFSFSLCLSLQAWQSGSLRSNVLVQKAAHISSFLGR